jgi:hypothetical protein
MMSDSDLRQSLLGTWRLVSVRLEVDGRLVKPIGDNPDGYLIYTPDNHVFVQFAARERPDVFVPRAQSPQPVLRETTGPRAAIRLGFYGYCGSFEVRGPRQVAHRLEFGIQPDMSDTVELRSVVLDGDRLILQSPNGGHLEWQRVHSAEAA